MNNPNYSLARCHIIHSVGSQLLICLVKRLLPTVIKLKILTDNLFLLNIFLWSVLGTE